MKEVTVVIPFYNGNPYLSDALHTLAGDAMVERILIVVDQGSEEPIFKKNDLNVDVLHNTDPKIRGAGVCRSLGFASAKSQFVAFLDCDDLWHEDKLGTQIALMKTNDTAFSFLTYRHFDSGSREFAPVVPIGPFTQKNFYKKRFTIGCLTVVIDKQKVPSVPKVLIKRRNDYVMWDYVIKYCIENDLNWHGFNTKPLAFHRLHEASLTSSRMVSAIYYFKFLRNCGHNKLLSMHYFLHYLLYTLGTR